jgi:hypothetical protein
VGCAAVGATVGVAAAVGVAVAAFDGADVMAVDGRVVAPDPPHAAAKAIKAAADMLRYLSFISSVSSSLWFLLNGPRQAIRIASPDESAVRPRRVENFGGLNDRWFRRKTTLCLPF